MNKKFCNWPCKSETTLQTRNLMSDSRQRSAECFQLHLQHPPTLDLSDELILNNFDSYITKSQLTKTATTSQIN